MSFSGNCLSKKQAEWVLDKLLCLRANWKKACLEIGLIVRQIRWIFNDESGDEILDTNTIDFSKEIGGQNYPPEPRINIHECSWNCM